MQQLASSVRLADVFPRRDFHGPISSSSSSATFPVFLPPQPPQYKLDPRLARLLGVHTQTRASIMQALWLYIKNNKLQDCHEKEYINCNRYFRQVTRQTGGMRTEANAYILYTSAVALIILKQRMEIILRKLCTFYKIHNFLGVCY